LEDRFNKPSVFFLGNRLGRANVNNKANIIVQQKLEEELLDAGDEVEQELALMNEEEQARYQEEAEIKKIKAAQVFSLSITICEFRALFKPFFPN